MARRNEHYVERVNSLITEKILLLMAVLSIVVGAVLGFMGSWHITLMALGIAIICVVVIVGRISRPSHLKKWVIFFLSIISIALIVSGIGLYILPIEKFLTLILPAVLLFIFLLVGIFFIISGAKHKDTLSVVMGVLFVIIAILIVAIFFFVLGGI